MVYIVLATGFEEIEAITPLDLLRRAGAEVLTAGVGGRRIVGSHGIAVEADITVEELDLTALDMLVLPGGLGGVASLRASQAVLDAVRFAWENGKLVGAICAAPTILGQLHITDGRRFTCYPGHEQSIPEGDWVRDAAVVRDGNLITGTSAGCAVPFGLALVAALKGQATAEAVAEKLVLR